MAIGMTAALIGSAVIGAGASMLSGSKNSKAISKASDAQAQATREATAAQEKARAENVQLQQPFYNTGTAAMGQMNALLGIGGGQSTQQYGAPQTVGEGPYMNPTPRSGGQGGTDWAGYVNANPDAMANWNAIQGTTHDDPFGGSLAKFGEYHYGADGARRDLSAFQPQAQAGAQGGAQQAAEGAYNQFKNYTGYTTRLAEGNNALNAGYAAGGTLQSGDAVKAFGRYNQDFAANEFGQYMNLMGGQQQLGAGAANALSGVNTNYANAASNLALQNGQNIANTAVARANNTNGMIQGIGGALSGALGGFGGGSSYGLPAPRPGYATPGYGG